jgi:hypothetical protein
MIQIDYPGSISQFTPSLFINFTVKSCFGTKVPLIKVSQVSNPMIFITYRFLIKNLVEIFIKTDIITTPIPKYCPAKTFQIDLI